MPAINFTKRFAALVASGEKRQTIRPTRKRPIKIGDPLYFYSGMRTRKCRRLGNAICLDARPITIDIPEISINGEVVSSYEIAKRDGFISVSDFLDFFNKRYGLPFYGILIQW